MPPKFSAPTVAERARTVNAIRDAHVRSCSALPIGSVTMNSEYAASRPARSGLDPGALVEQNHDARLVVELAERAAHPDAGGETATGATAEDLAAVPDEAVVRFAPEIDLEVGANMQGSAIQAPLLRFVQPGATLEHALPR